MESQIAPIEERVRAMVVDIVRTCQSTVARNFRLSIAPVSSAGDQLQPSQAIASVEDGTHTREDPDQTSVDGTAGDSLDFLREPSLLNAEASASLPGRMYSHNYVTGRQSQSSDSGYGSLSKPCDCSCHDFSDAWNTVNREIFSCCTPDSQLMR